MNQSYSRTISKAVLLIAIKTADTFNYGVTGQCQDSGTIKNVSCSIRRDAFFKQGFVHTAHY